MGCSFLVLEEIKNRISSIIHFPWESGLLIRFYDAVAQTFSTFSRRALHVTERFPVNLELQPYNVSCNPDLCSYPSALVLVLQWSPAKGFITASRLKNLLAGMEERKPDFIVLGENTLLSECPEVSLANPNIQAFAEVARMFNCIIVPGTMQELEGEKCYKTAPVIGSDGSLLGKYRKQRPFSLKYTPGNIPGIFPSKYGNFGVLICFDSENRDVVEETVAQHPFLILNPVQIQQKVPAKHAYSAASAAIACMRRQFEYRTNKQLFTIVRADTPPTGSSQAIGPYCSVSVPCPFETHFFVHVDITPHNQWDTITLPPDFPRTSMEDNVGNRYYHHQLQTACSRVSFLSPLANDTKRLVIAGQTGSSLSIWSTKHHSSISNLIGCCGNKGKIISCDSHPQSNTVVAFHNCGTLIKWKILDTCSSSFQPLKQWQKIETASSILIIKEFFLTGHNSAPSLRLWDANIQDFPDGSAISLSPSYSTLPCSQLCCITSSHQNEDSQLVLCSFGDGSVIVVSIFLSSMETTTICTFPPFPNLIDISRFLYAISLDGIYSLSLDGNVKKMCSLPIIMKQGDLCDVISPSLILLQRRGNKNNDALQMWSLNTTKSCCLLLHEFRIHHLTTPCCISSQFGCFAIGNSQSVHFFEFLQNMYYKSLSDVII